MKFKRVASMGGVVGLIAAGMVVAVTYQGNAALPTESGVVEEIISDNFAATDTHAASETIASIVTDNGRRYQISPELADVYKLRSGQRVSFSPKKTTSVDGGLKVLALQNVKIAEQTNINMVGGSHRLTIMQVYMNGGTQRPDSVEQMNWAGSYWKKQTNGAVSFLNASAWPWRQVPSSCDFDSIINSALKANGLSSWPNDPTQHLIVNVVGQTKCPWGGLGILGSNRLILLNLDHNGAAHELGHNLGLLHSKTDSCTGISSCEYGDLVTVMGGGPGPDSGSANVANADYLGVKSSVEVTGPGTYGINSIARIGSRRGIRIRNGSDVYYFQYRPMVGIDNNKVNRAWAGVQIHVVHDSAPRETHIIDAHANNNIKPQLTQGESWNVPGKNLKVQFLSSYKGAPSTTNYAYLQVTRR